MLVYDDGTGPALYVGGRFDEAPGGIPARNVARWDGSDWKVTYLLQNYSDYDVSRAILYRPNYRFDRDGDGTDEWFVWLGMGRQLHPQGFACFDLQTLECEWFLPLPQPGRYAHPFP